MFSYDEIDISATILTSEDKLVTIYNVCCDGLNLSAVDMKQNMDFRLSADDVDRLYKVLGEAKKHIEENR